MDVGSLHNCRPTFFFCTNELLLASFFYVIYLSEHRDHDAGHMLRMRTNKTNIDHDFTFSAKILSPSHLFLIL